MRITIKSLVLCLILCLFLLAAGTAQEKSPGIPSGDFRTVDMQLYEGKSWPVYTGPGEQYQQANAGKAVVSTNDWVQIFGGDGGACLMVQYAVNKNRLRIGWISAEAVKDSRGNNLFDLGESFRWAPCHLERPADFTDDPLLSREWVIHLEAGEQLSYLGRMGEWAYVEYAVPKPMCGFVPYDSLALDPVPVDSHPYFRYMADFLANAGIEAEATGIRTDSATGKDNRTLFFAFRNGGGMQVFTYGSEYDPVLTPLEFNCRLRDVSDEDLAKYLDAVFLVLADVEAGSADGARNWVDVERSRDVLVSNALLYQEYLGEQALRVLLEQLSKHDGRDELNSLRARLASRLLDVKDTTEVDPALGLDWYDSLHLAVQNALPPVDAGVWETDPVLRAAEQILSDQYRDENAGAYDSPGYEQSKGAFLVSLSECARKEDGKSVTVWASMGREQIAVYDNCTVQLVSGSFYPVRLTMEQSDAGFVITQVVEPRDGTDYWKSIVEMCNGDAKLAEKMMETDCNINEAKRLYLLAAGLPEAAENVK